MPTQDPAEKIAIKALLKEARKLSESLSNDGEEVTIEHIGNAVGIILILLAPMAVANYVTYEDLEKKLVLFRDECPVHQKWAEGKTAKFRIGPATFPMPTTSFGIAVMVFLYFVGKGNGWW